MPAAKSGVAGLSGAPYRERLPHAKGIQPTMLKRIVQAAFELDGWLHEHVGRAYVAILGWGLVLSIIGSLGVLEKTLSSGKSSVTTLVVLVFQSALLVNQLAQWHELKSRRRRHRAGPQPMRTASAPLADIHGDEGMIAGQTTLSAHVTGSNAK
jgi:hypothetical protein